MIERLADETAYRVAFGPLSHELGQPSDPVRGGVQAGSPSPERDRRVVPEECDLQLGHPEQPEGQLKGAAALVVPHPLGEPGEVGQPIEVHCGWFDAVFPQPPGIGAPLGEAVGVDQCRRQH